MMMDERKFRILQAIIDDYILTAVPVGSRTISKKYDMGLSSATIRNENWATSISRMSPQDASRPQKRIGSMSISC
mgnify:CR=1 FL=1